MGEQRMIPEGEGPEEVRSRGGERIVGEWKGVERGVKEGRGEGEEGWGMLCKGCSRLDGAISGGEGGCR